MERTIDVGSRRNAFTLDDFLDIHRPLLDGTSEERHAGLVRTEHRRAPSTDQNCIGARGLSPRDTTFVPPPPERVPPLLADLVEFVSRDDLPGLALAALAHAQLETLHPFGDGNGRAGRCLIHVAPPPAAPPVLVPPIRFVLATDARRYIAGLVDHREGRYDDWLGYFADQVRIACDATMRLHPTITALLDELLERAGSPRSDSVARKVVVALPSPPIVSAETVATRHGVTPTAARAVLNRLEQTGVLSLTRVGDRRVHEWGQRRAVPRP